MAKGVEQSTPAASVSAVDNKSTPANPPQQTGVGKPPSPPGETHAHPGVGIGGQRGGKRDLVTLKKQGWIEFKKSASGNRRYARHRMWIWVDGDWAKSKPVRAWDYPPMTETQYKAWKKKDAARKKARKLRDASK